MSDNQSVEATRRAHSVSIGEVSSRVHVEGESQDHFESASREFANPNKCHAVTFLFYRLNKIETIGFKPVAIERRVLDPAAPTPVAANPFRAVGQLATIPPDVPATSAQRVAALDRSLQADQQVLAQAIAPLPAADRQGQPRCRRCKPTPVWGRIGRCPTTCARRRSSSSIRS